MRLLPQRFLWEHWNLGIVNQTATDIVENGITQRVTWLSTDENLPMIADPGSCLLPDGRRVVMGEVLDRWRGKGEIWAATISPGESLCSTQFKRWISCGVHLSYPFPFLDEQGRLCLIVESWEARGLYLWREQSDGSWGLAGTIMAGRQAVDSTILHHNGKWWLFCSFEDDEPNSKLHLFYSDHSIGPWVPHPKNPVSVNAAGSRAAGPLFIDNRGRLIRPAQDCSRTYGGAVVLQHVQSMSETDFVETPVRTLKPIEPFGEGLHTLCPAGEYTIIDGKRYTFRLTDVPGSLARTTMTQLRRQRARRGCSLPSMLPGFL